MAGAVETAKSVSRQFGYTIKLGNGVKNMF